MSTTFNIVDLFQQQVKKTPDQIALIYQNEEITFKEFDESVDKTAQCFLRKGIRKGDRVLVFVPMSDDLYRVVLAIFKIGAVAVFLDEWVSVKRLNACCRLAECEALVGSRKARLLAWVVPGLRRIPLRLGLSHPLHHQQLPIPNTTTDDVALITFTTGSTGTPKAAIRTHGLLRAQFEALRPVTDPQPGEVGMATLPIVLLINLAGGVASVIADFNGRKPASLDPAKIVAQLQAHEVDCLIASPFFVRKLAEYLIARQLQIPKLTKILTGGAPVFPAEAQIFQRAFPAARIGLVYGSTEAEPISSIEAKELTSITSEGPTNGLPVGRPEQETTVKIIQISDEPIVISTRTELEALERKSGEIGEIIVSGKHVLRDYLHNEAALRRNKIFIGGQCWHRTGDSGFMDENGYLFLTGRCHTLIYQNEKIFSPFVFEARFQEIDGIAAGTIMQIDGQLCAVIEAAREIDRDALKSLISVRSPSPDRLIVVKKIPRDPRHNSKIDYERLKVQLGKKIS